MGRIRSRAMKIPAVLFCVITMYAVATLHATESHSNADSLDARLNRFHSCLHRAESANHCMHLRPAELDDHVDDDDLGDIGYDELDDDDEYGIGEDEAAGVGRGGGFLATRGSLRLGAGGAKGGGEE